MPRRLLVTSALPYANGHIHLGHLVEYLETDIWVRFQRLRGARAVYVCADDTHGTATMMRARKEGRSEAALIQEMQAAHLRDFRGFHIAFDHYGSTHSQANRELCEEVWAALQRAGLVREREVTQLYDPEAQVFLADRFVTGTCPKCGAKDQYGDSCEVCGEAYTATDLKDPKSTLSGATPVPRSAPHLFVEIERLRPFLTEWTQSGDHLQPEIQNYLKGHFLGDPLKDWDISRPAPYFGFEIPDAPGQFWYVWFDAPIGYMAATREWAEPHGESFDAWWRSPETEIVHFIGKDIVYFHTLFWPAMLKTAGFSLPRRVHAHGFLTVNGEKMAKRRGTNLLASTYLKHLDPECLRYYYASKLGPRIDDIDLNLDEFVQKVNSDVVGKVVNLVSRTARFLGGTGLAASYPEDGGLFASAAKEGDAIAEAYEACDLARAMRAIMTLADRANEYVDREEPWKLKKEGRSAELQAVASVALNLYRQLIIYLAPVLPELSARSAELWGVPIGSWEDAKTPLVSKSIATFRHLFERVDPTAVARMMDESREAEAPAAPENALPIDSAEALEKEPLAAPCSIDDFQKIDLRVARIIEAEALPEAKKLLKLKVTLGGDTTRTLFAGIKAAYEPEALVGRLVIVVANLLPRTMKFGVSEGMVTAAGGGGREVFLLAPDSGAKPGQRVH